MPAELNRLYGRLLTISKLPSSGGCVWWLCSCACGTLFHPVRGKDLSSGNTRSCGCSRFKRAKLSNSPTYKSWAAMRRRCNDPMHPRYRDYGGRGIRVCEQWNDADRGFEQFVADMGMRPKGLTLDRRNVNLGYNPRNCRWATLQQQRWNRRDFIARLWKEDAAEQGYWEEKEKESQL